MENAQHDLLILNLKNNAFRLVESYYFRGLKKLQVLILSHNQLVVTRAEAFDGLNDLVLFDISSNHISSFTLLSAPCGPSLVIVRGDVPILCCALVHVKDCEPSEKDKKKCFSLLNQSAAKAFVFIQATLVIAANSAALIFAKYVHFHEHAQMCHILLAQALMGLYLISIAFIDHSTSGEFFNIILWWHQHWACQVLAVVNFLSLAVPESILTYISFCRARTIVSIERQSYHLYKHMDSCWHLQHAYFIPYQC